MTSANFVPASQWQQQPYDDATYDDAKGNDAKSDDAKAIEWTTSDLTQGMYHAFIQISPEITLSVEAGGNPNHPPVLLIMGLGSQMLFWPDALIKQLVAAGFFVIRFDNRDIGLSSKIINPSLPNLSSFNRLEMMLRLQVGLKNRHSVAYRLQDMADDTAGLLNRLRQIFGFKQFHVLGASMGGMIAQILAANYPNHIDRLLLLFTSTNARLLPPPKLKQLNALFTKPDNTSLQASVAHGVWFMHMVGSPGFIDDEPVKRLITKKHLRNVHQLGVIQQLQAILATGDIRAYSQQIQAKTLVLHGDKDGLLPWHHGRNVANHIPNADFKLIKGLGHDLAGYFIPYLSHIISQYLHQK